MEKPRDKIVKDMRSEGTLLLIIYPLLLQAFSRLCFPEQGGRRPTFPFHIWRAFYV